MKKIIHLTDLHIGYRDLEIRFRDMLPRLKFHKSPAENYVIVITGDIVENGNEPGSFQKALVYVENLRSAGFQVLVVPGNHDYGPGLWGYAELVPAFKECFFGDASVSYPRLDLIDNIAFIGLDSMAEELNWYDRVFAEGELGDAQLERLKKMLNRKKVKNADYRVVYLHHHPFHPLPFQKLKDSEKLRKVLESHRIDALLFGHNHEGLVWNGAWDIPRVYDGGTSTGKNDMPNPHRVMDLSRDPAFDYDAKF